jgi:hypothetical protein
MRHGVGSSLDAKTPITKGFPTMVGEGFGCASGGASRSRRFSTIWGYALKIIRLIGSITMEITSLEIAGGQLAGYSSTISGRIVCWSIVAD